MTLDEIKKKVKEIDETKYDNEVAHNLEDDLYEEFIKHIAKTGNNEQREMARAVLKTKQIEFERWMA